jgi:hypothetical protein
MTLKGKHRNIGYISSWNSNGVSLWWEALLIRDGVPFWKIDGGACVRGCSSKSFPAFVAWDVKCSIDDEIALAESGRHLASRFLLPAHA